MRWYALAQRPWVEDASFEGGGWGLPPGTIGSVDLAPVGGQSHVFVTSDKPFDPADVAAAIGDGTRLDSYVPTESERTAWETLVGVVADPSWTLLDLLWETLTVEADPDGVTRAKPIMPTSKGVLELHLGGHSLIRAEKLPKDPTTHPAWANIQAVKQRAYRALQAQDRTLARKWLGNEQRRFRLSPEAARDLLIPADLPRELPLRPTTTVADDFNRADTTFAAGLGSSSEGWSWAEVEGTEQHRIAGNKCSFKAGNVATSVRANTNLSSDDHSVQVDVVTWVDLGAKSALTGPACRFSPSAATYYNVRIDFSTGNRVVRLEKRVSGSTSVIGAATGYNLSLPHTVKVSADGSTIKGYLDGVELWSETDTSITGNVQTGIGISFLNADYSDDDFQADTFEAADLLAESELVRVRSDSLGTGETQLRPRGRTSASDEVLAIDQGVQRLRELARRRGEGVALAETSTGARALSRLRNETAGIIETTAFVVEALAEALVRAVAEAVAMAEAVARPRRLARVQAELVGMAGAVARVGGLVSAAVPVITSRIRMRVGPSTRMNVPPARR